MDAKNFGILLKQIRLSKNLTQDQLAEGICSKNYISRLEAGERAPSAYTLEQLSLKLGENLYQYILASNYSNPLEVHTLKEQINTLRRSRRFDALLTLLQEITNHPDFLEGECLQFLLWHRGICSYECHHDFTSAYNLFISALQVTHPTYTDLSEFLQEFLTLQELHIFNSIAKLYSDTHQSSHSITLLTTLTHKLEHSYLHYENLEVYKVMLYNLSRFLFFEKNYQDSLLYINKLLGILLKDQTLYLLGESLYHKGTLYYYLKDYPTSKDLINRSLAIFHTTNKVEYIKIIEHNLVTLFKY